MYIEKCNCRTGDFLNSDSRKKQGQKSETWVNKSHHISPYELTYFLLRGWLTNLNCRVGTLFFGPTRVFTCILPPLNIKAIESCLFEEFWNILNLEINFAVPEDWPRPTASMSFPPFAAKSTRTYQHDHSAIVSIACRVLGPYPDEAEDCWVGGQKKRSWRCCRTPARCVGRWFKIISNVLK